MALLWLFKLPHITRDTVIVTLEKPPGFSPAQACSPTLVPHPGHVCSAPCLHSPSSCLFPSLQARYCLLRLTLLVLSLLDSHFRLCLSAFFWISWDCMNAALPKVTLNIGFPGSSVGKESALHAGEQGSVSGWGPLEKGIATHSSILAWKISWTEMSGGLQSMRSQGADTT